MARRTYLVGIRENACQNTLVVRHFGGLRLPSSVNGEGSQPLAAETSDYKCVLASVFTYSYKM